MTERDVVDFVVAQRESSLRRNKPLRDIQDALWRIYRNQEDFTDKEEWQSKISLPKGFSAVKQAAAKLRKMLYSSPHWVYVEGYSQEEQLIAPLLDKGVNVLMRCHPLKLKYSLTEALESGLAVGMSILRVQPEAELDYADVLTGERTDRISLAVRAVDYRRFHFGPNTTPDKIDWCIEELEVPYALIKNSGKFSNLDKIERDAYKRPSEDEDKDNERFDKASDPNAKMPQINEVGLWEYFGDVFDKQTQTVVARDQHISLLNGMYLGFNRDIPYWHRRKKPYAIASPLHLAFRFPGQGLLEASKDLFRATNRLANLDMDGLEYAMLKQFEVDISALENPADVATGIEPGKLWRKKRGGNIYPAIREVQVSDIKQGGLAMQGILDVEIQRGTFVTDTGQGLEGTRSGDTATEIAARASASSDMLLAIAEDFEDQLLGPTAEMLAYLAIQYYDSSTRPNWSTLLGAPNDLDTMPREARAMLFGAGYDFSFYGLSEALKRRERAGQLLEAMAVIGQQPVFQMMVNLPQLFRDLLYSIGAGDYVNPQAEQIYQAFIQQQMQQGEEEDKTAEMEEQFAARNEKAMERDAYKHALAKDMAGFKAGLQAASMQMKPKPEKAKK